MRLIAELHLLYPFADAGCCATCSGRTERVWVTACRDADEAGRARREARAIANLADKSPLIRAADRCKTLRKFAPLLLEAIDFKDRRRSATRSQR
jgi:hypothetical protein